LILTRLILENFGVFKGRCEFDLRPSRDPFGPVILIGGMNGTGKTTILESVLLCLYGPAVFGVAPRRASAFLASRIHRSPSLLVPIDEAAITLEFELGHLGVMSRYNIVRRWRVNGDSVSTEVRAYRDGKQLEDVSEAQWEAFIRELIPPELAKLYFFDAEKVKELANGVLDAKVLERSVRGLLGLELIDRLQSDLDILARRYAREVSESEEIQEVEETRNAMREVDSQIEAIVQEAAGLESQLGGLRGQLERQEREFRSLGGGYFLAYGDLRNKRETLRSQLDEVEERLRLECADLLPFALIPELCERLQEQLDRDATARTQKLVRQWVEDVKKGLRSTDSWSRAWSEELPDGPLKERLLADVIRFLETQLGTDLEPAVVHDLGEEAERRVRRWMAEAEALPSRILTLGREHEALTRELENVQLMLHRVPEDDVAKPAYERMLVLQREIGTLEERIRARGETVSVLRRQREELQRRLARLQDKVATAHTLHRKMRMIAGVSKVLRQYAQELSGARARELQQYISECHQLLARKRDLIRDIEVDPVTFRVTLRDARGSEIPKEILSAGERQIYAFTILWSLAKCARREFPFVIDTPLARLDSVHRERFIRTFLPAASPQVVLLSTDTEVEAALFSQMEGLLSRAYRLRHDDSTHSTLIEPGYFWESPQVVSA